MAIDATKIAKVKTAMDNRYENKQSNKKTVISGSYTEDNDSYPTVLACLNKFGELVTSWSAEPSDTKYPSEKLVADTLATKISKSSTVGLVKNDGTIDTDTFVKTSNTVGLIKNDGTIDTDTFIKTSDTAGLIKNDGTIDTNVYLTQHQSLENYIAKSQTVGLVKNDGTIDENVYLTQHQSLSDIGGVIDVDEKSSANTGAFKTYEITQGGTTVGEIDIPKDFLVKSGSVKTVGATPTTKEAAANLLAGDLYISLIINSKDNATSTGDDELIIPANGLVEDTTYDADNSTLQLTGTTFSIKSGGVTVTELANDAVETAKIKDSNVTTAKIADGNVTAAKLASNSVETDKIKDANVTTAKIADLNITTAKLASEAVTTAKIADANVTYAKLSSSCISSLTSDADAEINQALDDLAEAIYPTPVAGGDD